MLLLTRFKMPNIKCLLLDILNDLEPEDLGLFRWHLTNGVEGFQHIPKEQIEKVNKRSTVHKMVESYSPDGAAQITLKILRMMSNTGNIIFTI